ncbi:phosphotransferase enzyme family protein [Aspergillus nomiae NRRL 13137]|uniref:Phosphotransferase enzyme family protein n=1 Tax=Aspergillus nomiae NRRL (strain ATCC 15546 / NRRL 13137 / CBS 260.88 / M93) TaxID=1509407 RepID=A0A0L1IZF8_ASPN3|nr:phosphotransferase enzyme family protein [Aspergillus nomiae NRRL 13137]KNG84887.1 phosphotransferase enzyme family protein [Aspergillus nomiae NRRL 13137]
MERINELQSFNLSEENEREIVFLESSFFRSPNRHLPTPAQVKASSGDASTSSQPRPVTFENLGLIVKFGPYVTVAEARCLRFIRMTFQERVPVPEVFGWRIDEESNVFIYMEPIEGQTLLDRWDWLSTLDRNALCDQLHHIIGGLRQLEQEASDKYIRSLGQKRLLEYVFQEEREAGPFSSIEEFNDWFSFLPQSRFPMLNRYKDPYREFLPDTGEIKFTHADLHRGNIIVSTTGPARILAIVDWAQAGWYPDYWEYCKARYTCWYEDEWGLVWIEKFLFPRVQEFEIFAGYTMAMGAI